MSHVRGSAEWMTAHFGRGWPDCQAPLKSVEIFGRNLTVHKDAVRAFRRLDRIFKENAPAYYKKLCEQFDVGTFNCRPIGGTQTASNHSFGTAIDLDTQENAFGKDPFACPIWTQAKKAVLKVENEGPEGMPLFRWGGRYRTPDAMHFEVMLTPSELSRRLFIDGRKKPQKK